jgi:hypothetical protein
VIKSVTSKFVGNTAVCHAAKMQPLRPATAAPIAKASSFRRRTGMPIASAASASSRSARHALPTREPLMWCNTSQTSASTASNR